MIQIFNYNVNFKNATKNHYSLNEYLLQKGSIRMFLSHLNKNKINRINKILYNYEKKNSILIEPNNFFSELNKNHYFVFFKEDWKKKIQEDINSKKITTEIFNTYIVINIISRFNNSDRGIPIEIFDSSEKLLNAYELLFKNFKIKNYSLKLIFNNKEVLRYSSSGNFNNYGDTNLLRTAKKKATKKKRKIKVNKEMLVSEARRNDSINMRFEPISNETNDSIQTIFDNI